MEVLEKTDKLNEDDETIEPRANKMPVVVLLSAIALTAGYFGIRRVRAR